MPDIRHDELSDTTVIVAAGRATRPDTFGDVAPFAAGRDEHCPFCPGNEHQTPPEVARTGGGRADAPGWSVRVVPNLYPIATDDGQGVHSAHEVVVLSPAHDASFASLGDRAASEVLTVLRDRARAHLDAGAEHAVGFINHRRAGGASIEHPHAQVVALGLVPEKVAAASDRFTRSDPVATQLRAARAQGLVVDEAKAPTWCPPASARPYEMVVAGRTMGRFDDASDDEVAAVAQSVRTALARLRLVLGDVAYNVVVQTTPRPQRDHWYVRIAPRVTVEAGLELATGLFVNVVAPDAAAAALRSARP